ncbi:MAG: DUF3179 domain-containing protein [Pseudomonadota bacterium]
MRMFLAFLLIAVALPVFADDVPAHWKRDWPKTDFSRLAVDPAEVLSGGPPKDGIPAIANPVMIAASSEDKLDPREPVMSVEAEGMPARAYPLRYLMWHEIVNDRIRDVPIAVTFCPLCNSGLVFDLRLPSIEGHMEIELGVSGLLRHSDMIMFDRQTESWWQQFTGEAIAGFMTGAKLLPLPALLESWERFREAHPDGVVMAEPEQHGRPYGFNPYRGYDSGAAFLYRGDLPPHGVEPLARVVRVGDRAWPLTRLVSETPIEEAGVRIDWQAGQASALDTEAIAEGRDVGNIRVTDLETGTPVVHEVVFAFAFHAFTPHGDWMLGN